MYGCNTRATHITCYQISFIHPSLHPSRYHIHLHISSPYLSGPVNKRRHIIRSTMWSSSSSSSVPFRFIAPRICHLVNNKRPQPRPFSREGGAVEHFNRDSFRDSGSANKRLSEICRMRPGRCMYWVLKSPFSVRL